MKQAFWKKDWLSGLAICIIIVSLGKIGLFDSLERSAYDLGVRSSERIPSNKIAIIAIDDVSISNIGRWPWPRDVHAEMHQLLKKGDAKLIGQTTFFIEPQLDPGLAYIQDLLQFYGSSNLLQMNNRNRKISADIALLGNKLLEAEESLNTDKKLADSLRLT